jgi:hypothetical protein
MSMASALRGLLRIFDECYADLDGFLIVEDEMRGRVEKLSAGR